ncbi:ABC transporter [Yoonia algicola]|uniref:ABC transporter n=1 Tax=Yoonia algicola TaxID=3137368 RepID=A0AAN0NHI9_9RHOB
MIILALKNGVISTMLDRLVDDPANRELIAVGAGRHDDLFFTTFRDRDDVAFIVPATRTINAVANAARNVEARKLVRRVTLIPSGANDPLSPDAQVGPGAILLSAKLAEDLGASTGDTIELRIERRIDDAPETAVRDMRVAGIVPAQRYSRSAMFIALQDLVAIEQFRDDRNLTAQDWAQARPLPETFASFRLYAKELRDIARLEDALEVRGINARPRAENVDLLISFQRSLNLLFIVIAALALAGFWAAMAANLRGSVERQRISLSLLRLLGLTEAGRRAIPTIQALILVTLGVFVTLILVLPTLALINNFFTPEGFQRIAQLGPNHIFGTLALGVFTALTASIWAVTAIGDITSDEVLRAG